jgi:hypothetical protein
MAEDFFGDMGGWPVINRATRDSRTDEERQRDAEEQFDFDCAVAQTFRTPAGQRVLAWMERLSNGCRFEPMDTGDGMTIAFRSFYREGQFAFFREIKRAIARAEAGPPQFASQDGENAPRNRKTRKAK